MVAPLAKPQPVTLPSSSAGQPSRVRSPHSPAPLEIRSPAPASSRTEQPSVEFSATQNPEPVAESAGDELAPKSSRMMGTASAAHTFRSTAYMY